jgi:hypothetical protein
MFHISYKLNAEPPHYHLRIISGLLKKLVIVLFFDWTMQKNARQLMIGHTLHSPMMPVGDYWHKLPTVPRSSPEG